MRENSGDRWNVALKNASLKKVGSRNPAAAIGAPWFHTVVKLVTEAYGFLK
jgi:hypothetical protein